MKTKYDVFGSSFRKLSAEKLGTSVLELCVDDDRKKDDSEKDKNNRAENTKSE